MTDHRSSDRPAPHHGSPWQDGWPKRLCNAASRLGHDSICAFGAAHPAASYFELAAILGPSVVALQVEWLERDELTLDGARREFAMRALVRFLAENLPDGWGVGQELEFATASTFSTWVTALHDDCEEPAWAVWQRLRANVPTGWKPASAADERIQTAFADIPGFEK